MPAKQPSSSHQPHLAPIPDGLQRQLEAFRKKLWRIKISEALLAGCAGLITSFLFVFLLDRFFETPTSVRLIILLAGTSLFAVFAPHASASQMVALGDYLIIYFDDFDIHFSSCRNEFTETLDHASL